MNTSMALPFLDTTLLEPRHRQFVNSGIALDTNTMGPP